MDFHRTGRYLTVLNPVVNHRVLLHDRASRDLATGGDERPYPIERVSRERRNPFAGEEKPWYPKELLASGGRSAGAAAPSSAS